VRRLQGGKVSRSCEGVEPAWVVSGEGVGLAWLAGRECQTCAEHLCVAAAHAGTAAAAARQPTGRTTSLCASSWRQTLQQEEPGSDAATGLGRLRQVCCCAMHV
jgi:hypothetical protein